MTDVRKNKLASIESIQGSEHPVKMGELIHGYEVLAGRIPGYEK